MIILNFRNKWVCGNSDQERPLSCPSWCPPPLSTQLVLTVLGEQAVQKEKVHIPKMPWKYSRPMAVKLLPILTLHCVYVTPLEKRLLSKALSYQSSEGLSVVIKSISSPPDEWKLDTCSIHSTWIQHLFMAQTLRIQRKRTLLLMLRFYNSPHFITRCYCLMLLSSFPHRQMFSGDRVVSHTQVSCSNNLISLYSA